jgi:hypothetical protein
MVDCSGGEFSYVNFIFFFCNINHHIKMIAFLSATKACRSKRTSVSLEVLLWLQAPLSFVLATLT